VKAELSEIKADEGIVVIAASNKENLIDQATRDRFEPNVFYVHPPLNDKEWTEVVEIHLRKFQRFINPEVDATKITRLFRTQRILSPRAASETIAEAHRLWASEISAAYELRASKDEAERASVGRKYAADLERLKGRIESGQLQQGLTRVDQVDEFNYLIGLCHFEKAIQALESSQAKQRREMEEALILSSPTQGASFGLYATEDGTGGIITVQCSVRPATPGEPRVSVTGNSTSAVIGQLVLPDESVRQSAENAAEAVSAMLWAESRLDVSRLHMHFQIRSILEGAPGQGVSGPSAGLAMVLALLSELSGLPISPSTVATGTIGVKLDIGPVGGLGGYGAQTGKIVGILKSQKVRVTDLVLPAANFEVAGDEMDVLKEEGVSLHPITVVSECLSTIFGVDKQELVSKIKERVVSAATLSQPT